MGVDSGAEVPVVSFDADVVVSGLFVTKVVVVSPPACTVKLFFWIYANSDRGTSCDVNKTMLFQLFSRKICPPMKASEVLISTIMIKK